MMLFAKACVWLISGGIFALVAAKPTALIVTATSKSAAESLSGASVTQVQMILYFYGVLFVRFMYFLMKEALGKFIPYYEGQSIEHKNKTATMLIKGVYYLLGFFYMLPLTWIVGCHLVAGTTPELDPFWNHYWTLTGTILNAFYIFEVVIPFAEDWTLWLHHTPVFFLTLLWSGALPAPSVTVRDRVLVCVGYGVPVLQFTCMNAILNLLYGYRHLRPPCPEVVKALGIVAVEVAISTVLRNIWLLAWAFVYYSSFDDSTWCKAVLFTDFFWTLHNIWIIRRTLTIKEANAKLVRRQKHKDVDATSPRSPRSPTSPNTRWNTANVRVVGF